SSFLSSHSTDRNRRRIKVSGLLEAGFVLSGGCFGCLSETSIGNYSPLIAQQPVKLKIHRQRWRAGSSPATGTMSEQAMYRLLRHFYKKPERAHAAAPSLQIEPAALGFGLVFYGNHNFCIATHTKPIESAPISNR